jgi:hypothetical protein
MLHVVYSSYGPRLLTYNDQSRKCATKITVGLRICHFFQKKYRAHIVANTTQRQRMAAATAASLIPTHAVRQARLLQIEQQQVHMKQIATTYTAY